MQNCGDWGPTMGLEHLWVLISTLGLRTNPPRILGGNGPLTSHIAQWWATLVFSWLIFPLKMPPAILSEAGNMFIHLWYFKGTQDTLQNGKWKMQGKKTRDKKYHFFVFLSICMYVRVPSHFSHVCLFVALWTTASQAPLSMGFSRQEYWSELPCPTRDLPEPGIKPLSLKSLWLAGGFFTSSTTWEA